MEGETAGDPCSNRQWVRSTLRSLSARLDRRVSPPTVARLLRKQGLSPRVNVKRFTGPPHPDRDRQFGHIAEQRAAFTAAGAPVISVDTKKKELIGNFKNPGRRWCRQADAVNAHDFPQDAECRAVPYGIYDVRHNQGHVGVGTSADTPPFAVETIRNWWNCTGRHRYPGARHLLILADGGGSNGCRPRLWKLELQRWADESGLEITVCHYPQGTSKWNPIEHRLFSQISRTWAGYPLRNVGLMLGFIRGTVTQTGLKVAAVWNRKKYPTAIKVSNRQMKELNIHRHNTCPAWNYTIRPRC